MIVPILEESKCDEDFGSQRQKRGNGLIWLKVIDSNPEEYVKNESTWRIDTTKNTGKNVNLLNSHPVD